MNNFRKQVSHSLTQSPQLTLLAVISLGATGIWILIPLYLLIRFAAEQVIENLIDIQPAFITNKVK